MKSERRARGFERAGTCAMQGLGLTGARAAELRLAVAWRAAAGEEIARRVSRLRVRAGVLEVEVGDPRWAEAIDELLPRLAARLDARDGTLAIRGARVVVPGRPRGPVRTALSEAGPVGSTRLAAGPSRDQAPDSAAPEEEASSRLLRAAERCLSRGRT